MSALPAYRHSQLYTLLWIILPATLAVVALTSGSQPRQGDAWVGLGVVAAVTLGTLATLGRLVIEIHDDQLRWQFGYLGWPRWRVALADITTIERLRAPRIAGSGIKGSRQHRLYNVTIGGPAVKLTLADGRSVTLGTPEPERLAAFLEARRPPRR